MINRVCFEFAVYDVNVVPALNRSNHIIAPDPFIC